jgi:TonB family protein
MKTKLFIAIGLLAGSAAFGNQIIPDKPIETEKNKPISFNPPVFTGTKLTGEEVPGKSPLLIYSYLRENVEYPKVALKYNIQGTEVVQFTITSTGEVTSIKVLNSVCPEIDDEVIRVLKTTQGMWEPGLKNGKPVEMEREISMVFQIDGFKNGTNENIFKEQVTALYKKGNKALISQNNPEKALKYFNKALKYLPYESTILNSRAIAKSLLNDKDGAQQDWNRVDGILAAKSEREKNLQLFTQNGEDVKVNQENQIIITK